MFATSKFETKTFETFFGIIACIFYDKYYKYLLRSQCNVKILYFSYSAIQLYRNLKQAIGGIHVTWSVIVFLKKH